MANDVKIKTSSNVNKMTTNGAVYELEDDRPCLTCGERCPGFRLHNWRNICKHCKCSRLSHDLQQNEFATVDDRLGFETSGGGILSDLNLTHSGCKEAARKLGYTWIPRGLMKDKVDEFMDSLDNHKIPKIGSVGAKYRTTQLIGQLPKQDLSAGHCRQLTTSEQEVSFQQFAKQRDEEALDVGIIEDSLKKVTTCHRCDGELEVHDMAVIAMKAGPDLRWHPACFCCEKCSEILVDLCYCHKDGSIYCERHYAELMRPRCAACDELIFAVEYTKAMDQDWHSSHFSCFQCDLNLTGHRYILREEHPYCIQCYETLFAHSCEQCKKTIGTDSKDLSYKDMHWHEKCFTCSACSTTLVDQPFATNNSRLYCAACHDNQFAARCDKCSQVFRAGMKKYEYNGKQWHEHCFLCKECLQPISSSSFVPRDDHIICVPCYEQRYAQRCAKCDQVINAGGVTYKNAAWHRDCFTCTNCKKMLAGEKFTSHLDKPYCADCYGTLYAKKCASCGKPITGLGTTKFITFEDRHWHSDCFQCSKCQVSLVGQGFLTEGLDIICPECSQD